MRFPVKECSEIEFMIRPLANKQLPNSQCFVIDEFEIFS